MMVAHFCQQKKYMTNNFHTRLRRFSLIGLGFCTIQTFAGAFSLYTEGSVSAIQNFAAGIAAEGRDASVAWYNPAAMVLLKKPELVIGGIGVTPTLNLSGTASFYQININDDELLPPYQQTFKDIDGGREAIVPNLHLVMPLGDRFAYGLSVLVPYGLSSNWSDDSPLRYAGTLSSLRVVDVSPEIAGYVTDHFSLGAGVDFQWADVNFNNVIGSPAALEYGVTPPQPPTLWDSPLENHGTSYGVGFHVGALFTFLQDRTRFGFDYHYGVTQQFKGYSIINGVLADNNLENADAELRSDLLTSNHIKFPDIYTFSLFQKVSDKVDMMGSIVYSIWSPFNSIQLNNIAVVNPRELEYMYTNATTYQNYQNTLRASFGMNFQLTDKWQLRWGGGYDQTPTNNQDRDSRLPDLDKLAIAVGAHWQYNEHLGFDVGYSYLFPISDIQVNKYQQLDADNWITVNATGHGYAQLFGVQAVLRK
jgi:long-chain fatty acid transport protein